MSNQTTDEQTNNQSNSKEKKKTLLVVIILALIIICILLGVIIYLLTRGDESEVVIPDNVVTPDNVSEVVNRMEETEEEVPVSAYEVSMNIDWVFPDGNSPSTNAFVENSTNNVNTVYFTMCLADTKEQIYKSPYLMVGSSLDEIKLDTPLPKGTYKTILTYNLVDDEYKEISSVSMYLTITIEN